MANLKYQNPGTVDAVLESVQSSSGVAAGTSDVQREVISPGEDSTGQADVLLQMLDEMRAIRLGIQAILDYLNPASGFSNVTPLTPMLAIPNIYGNRGNSTEVDLIELAQSVRSEVDS